MWRFQSGTLYGNVDDDDSFMMYESIHLQEIALRLYQRAYKNAQKQNDNQMISWLDICIMTIVKFVFQKEMKIIKTNVMK